MIHHNEKLALCREISVFNMFNNSFDNQMKDKEHKKLEKGVCFLGRFF